MCNQKQWTYAQNNGCVARNNELMCKNNECVVKNNGHMCKTDMVQSISPTNNVPVGLYICLFKRCQLILTEISGINIFECPSPCINGVYMSCDLSSIGDGPRV